MQKPFNTYFGGKGSNGTYQTIINFIRPHQRFIEVFAGNATISRKMKKAQENILIDINPDVCRRLSDCLEGYKVLNQSGITFLMNDVNTNKLKTTYFLDPPYPLETRKSTKRYDYELSNEEHEHLLKIALQLKGDVLISTYPNDMYKKVLSGWYLHQYKSTTRGGQAIEWLFMNYEPQEISQLHDYSYLGGGHRQRQLYRKKMKRWLDNFSELPQLFQNQLIEELLKQRHL
ncbi:hypothetical protein [Emticicia sp. 17c]|uniref:hypothetical protein n=1 Tax=Emticicia sp. 17c TaxID=3127704 RepID=UPI00301CF673